MIKELYEQICAGDEVRANLIRLREELKEEENRREFAYLLGGDFSNLTALLKDEDPKVRKNAALILGEQESEDLLPVLFDAYKNEKTLFIRADYLKAISGLDYRPLGDLLEKKLQDLREKEDWTPEEWKHVSEEIRILQTMVLRCRGIRHHRFAGGKEKEDVILLTNRRQRKVTADQVQKGKITMLAGGLRVEGASLKEIRSIRTYSELLFPLKTNTALMADQPVQCGEAAAEPLLALADRLYNGAGAFLYRIDVRGGEFSGSYIRKLSDALERASGARLVNSVTDYELELRLVLKKDGIFTAMLKPSSSFDERFTYRKEAVAASIAPVNAALTARLALPWLKEGAQVLDPFCGVGTMLIERDRARTAGTMYGLDIFGEAIEKARRNTRRADRIVNYIQRDFFTFRHEYRFDEVITNMPASAGEGSKQSLRALYHSFFSYVGGLLKDSAVLILYTTAPNYVVESVQRTAGFRIEKSFLLNEKNQTTVFVIQWKQTE